MAKLNIYKDNPTAGDTDGVKVSSTGDFSEPVHFALDARNDDDQILQLALRCDEGYKTRGTTTLTDYNDINDRYSFCKTAGGSYFDSITFEESIGATNVIFFAKARTTGSDYSALERSAKFLLDYDLEWA